MRNSAPSAFKCQAQINVHQQMDAVPHNGGRQGPLCDRPVESHINTTAPVSGL